MKKTLLSTLVVLGCAFSPGALGQPWEGPFGLQMGLTGDQLQAAIPGIKKISGTRYSFDKAPKHYPGTDFYIADVGGAVGLCKISAVNMIESSNFGDAVKAKFASIHEALSSKYGKPTGTYDFLKHGSLWSEPRDWMMGLAKGDRFLSSFWSREKDNKNQLSLPSDISTIGLESKGRSSSMASIHISYEFSNLDACIAEAKKNSADAL